VKPDWYLLWVYGALRLIPGTLSVRVLGATIGPEAIGAMLVPGILSLIVVLVPWLDRTSSSLYYAESLLAAPRRLSLGLAVVMLFLALSLADHRHEELLRTRQPAGGHYHEKGCGSPHRCSA
jgi:cytochrome b-561